MCIHLEGVAQCYFHALVFSKACKVQTNMVERNPGIELDLAWVERSRINLPAVERRAATHKTRRSVKKEWQAAWLLRAVSCIDLTTLDGDDTPSKVVTVRGIYQHYIAITVYIYILFHL